MARKKNNSRYLKEYRKERRRVTNLISKYIRKGYDVEFQLPPIPKKVTAASVRRLAAITPQKLREKSYAPNLETGEKITVKEFMARGMHRRDVQWKLGVFFNTPETPIIEYEPAGGVTIPEAPKDVTVEPPTDTGKPQYADIIISSFEELIEQYPKRAQQIVMSFYKEVTKNMARTEIADWLQETNEAGLWLTPEEAYHDDNVYSSINEMLRMLELSGGEKRAILDSIADEVDIDEELFF